jgi:hypothetical protein
MLESKYEMKFQCDKLAGKMYCEEPFINPPELS